MGVVATYRWLAGGKVGCVRRLRSEPGRTPIALPIGEDHAGYTGLQVLKLPTKQWRYPSIVEWSPDDHSDPCPRRVRTGAAP
jgi:hypothetical protein